MLARLPLFLTCLAIPAVVALTPRFAEACSCLPAKPPADARNDADAVFEGKLVGQSEADADHTRFEFSVSRVWKGDVAASTYVVSHKQSATCGRTYRAETTYVVYARTAKDGGLTDGLCSRSRPVEDAAEDLRVLGEGRAPGAAASGGEEAPAVEPATVESPGATPTAEPPPAAPPRGCSMTAAPPPGLALLLLAGSLAARRRRP
jgi:MYXO-CTERM domain-containing protein